MGDRATAVAADAGLAAPASAPPETRDRILGAAAELFEAQGYGGTTIRQIADRAGANSMLIYYYFGSKAELFHAVVGEPAKRVREMLERAAVAEGTVRSRLDRFAREYLAAVLSNAPVVTAMARSVFGVDPELQDWLRPRFASNLGLLRRLLEEGVERGEFRGVDARLAAGSLMGMLLLYATMGPIVLPALDLEGTEALPDVLAEHTIRVFMEGVRRNGGEA